MSLKQMRELRRAHWAMLGGSAVLIVAGLVNHRPDLTGLAVATLLAVDLSRTVWRRLADEEFEAELAAFLESVRGQRNG